MVARGVFGDRGPGPKQGTIHESDFQVQDIVLGGPVFERMRTSGRFSQVPPDGAGAPGGWIGGNTNQVLERPPASPG